MFGRWLVFGTNVVPLASVRRLIGPRRPRPLRSLPSRCFSVAAENEIEPCDSLARCERPTLSKKVELLMDEIQTLNKKLVQQEKKLVQQEKNLNDKLMEQDNKLMEQDNKLNGIRCALAPVTTQAMAEACIYKQAKGLSSRFVSPQSKTFKKDQEGLQYRWSQVGLDVLHKLLDNSQDLNVKWKRAIFGGNTNQNYFSQELRMEAICAILSGLTFFVKTVPSSTLLSWPPDRNRLAQDGVFLDALLGPFESKNEMDDLQEIAGVIQSWVPSKVPVQQVPKGCDYEQEQTRRQVVEPVLESLVLELEAKLPQGSIGSLQATKQSVLKELCKK